MGATASKYRFIIGLSHLKISEPLGRGDKIRDDLLITNDNSVVHKLMGRDFRKMIGELEWSALANAGAIIYYEGSVEDKFEDAESMSFLTSLLALVELFQSALWMVKDNAVNFASGFLEVWAPNGEYRVHSNFLAKVFFNADSTKNEVELTRSELRKAREFFTDSSLPVSPLLNTKVGEPEFVMSSNPKVPRVSRAFYFIGAARSNFDLGVKVAMYCTMYETLFSTDATEVTHKICHRIAMFLEIEPDKRRDVYSRIKKAYGIRSKVVHGDEITTALDKVQSISADADEIARRIMQKIHTTPGLWEQFQVSKKDLEEYFLRESFGGMQTSGC